MSASDVTVEGDANSNQPLAGITVLDLSHVYNGPYATFLMAMAGADVIKIEPFQGEHLRSRGDMGGAALPFAMLNSNKKPVTLNLKTEKGRELLREMVARADILVENFAPGVMERLGLGSAALHKINPRLIYGSSSGYGKDGPYPRLPGDGSRDAGDVRRHQLDRIPGSAARQVGCGHLRFHGRHPSLCSDHDGAFTSASEPERAARSRSRCRMRPTARSRPILEWCMLAARRPRRAPVTGMAVSVSRRTTSIRRRTAIVVLKCAR
jgi:hypothetical protein